nr:hypothetical protein [uncultured Moraxella sp.]
MALIDKPQNENTEKALLQKLIQQRPEIFELTPKQFNDVLTNIKKAVEILSPST